MSTMTTEMPAMAATERDGRLGADKR